MEAALILSSSAVAESRVRSWQAHVRALAVSGLSRRGAFRRHQLFWHALTYRVRKYRRAQGTTAPAALVEVLVLTSPLVPRSRPAFRLHLGDNRLLEIEADFNAASLGRLLGILESRCCP